VSDNRTSIAQLLLKLQADAVESRAQLTALLAKLRRCGDPPPRAEPPEPPPFRPAAGARPPAPPAEPLDVCSKVAA
jgi:hypothetical protein